MDLKRFEIAGTIAYGQEMRLVSREEFGLFQINPSIEMHILRHFSGVSEEYQNSLLEQPYHYFDHATKQFREGYISRNNIQQALQTKGTKFNKYVSGIANPRELLQWLQSQTAKLLQNNKLYLIQKGLEFKIYLQFDYPEIVGDIDIISFENLTEEERAKVRTVSRSEGHDNATQINVIKGKEKVPTKSIAFLLHKVPVLDFFFGTAFPGRLDPDFGNDSEEKKKYWDSLVFIL